MNIASAAIRHSRAAVLVAIALVVAGAFAAFSLPSSIYPPLEFPRIVTIVKSGTLPPQSLMLTVTRPSEQAIMEVPGIRRVRSTSFRGATEISAQFDPSTDMIVALQQVQGKVDDARQELPEGTDLVGHAGNVIAHQAGVAPRPRDEHVAVGLRRTGGESNLEIADEPRFDREAGTGPGGVELGPDLRDVERRTTGRADHGGLHSGRVQPRHGGVKRLTEVGRRSCRVAGRVSAGGGPAADYVALRVRDHDPGRRAAEVAAQDQCRGWHQDHSVRRFRQRAFYRHTQCSKLLERGTNGHLWTRSHNGPDLGVVGR